MVSFTHLSRDARVLVLARGIRGFAFGFISLVIAFYLVELGYNRLFIGLLLSLTLAGITVSNVIVSVWADRIGRRRTLLIFAALMLASSIVLVLSTNVYSIILAFLVGSVSSTGTDSGPFLAIEQSALPDTATKEDRNSLFSIYNIAGNLLGATGSLFFGLQGTLQRDLGLSAIDSFRFFFVVYGVAAVAVAMLYLLLSKRIELSRDQMGQSRFDLGRDAETRRSASIIARLSGLFALDSFAGGFVIQALVAIWFGIQFKVGSSEISLIFFVAGILTTTSFIFAARLADRIGLIRTMVFTHIPSNILLMLVPLSPSFLGALGLYLARMSLSQMDVPTRQAYVVSIVPPQHRTAAAALTGVSRNVTASVSPTLAGYFLQAVELSAPFFIAGGLKIVYDLLIYYNFRHLHE